MAQAVATEARLGWRERLSATPYLLLAPAVVALAAVSVYPLFYGIRASVERYRYGRETGFVGLDNYRTIYHDETFWDALRVTLKFVVLTVSIETVLGLVFLDVWEWTPLLFLILLAGLQGLPQEPLEAARVDGAGRVQTFLHHTLPLLRPVLLVAIVLRTIDAIGTFDQIFVLTRGGPGTATQLISIYGYNTAFRFSQYGYAAAMLLSLLVFMLLLMAAVVRQMRRAAAGAEA